MSHTPLFLSVLLVEALWAAGSCLREELRSGILVLSLPLTYCVTPDKSPATSHQSPVPMPWFSPSSHIQPRQELELRGRVISISGPHLLPFPSHLISISLAHSLIPSLN